MYRDLKRLGIANKEAARALLALDRKVGGGKTISQELENRSMISRKYVKAEPGGLDEASFRPFSASASDIAGRLMGDPKQSLRALEAHFTGEAAGNMERALAEWDIDPSPYRNALARIEAGSYPSPHDKLLLSLMLFLICGCLADPRRAVVLEEEFAEERLGASIKTVTAKPGLLGEDEDDPSEATVPDLGIIRIFEDMTMGENYSLHVLPATEEGATIGSGACDITDVDASVSRRHARIWCEDGRWYIAGLGSTNGTSVVSGVDGSVRVVESPRSERGRSYEPQPFEIGPADILRLGTTSYIVRAVNRG